MSVPTARSSRVLHPMRRFPLRVRASLVILAIAMVWFVSAPPCFGAFLGPEMGHQLSASAQGCCDHADHEPAHGDCSGLCSCCESPGLSAPPLEFPRLSATLIAPVAASAPPFPLGDAPQHVPIS